MNSVSQALLAADTDETQAYVFESNKLPEIRGASRQLDLLNERIGQMVQACPGDLIYAGGGSLLAEVPAAAAAQLVQQIERLYPQETGVATISADWRILPPSWTCFGDLVRWAGHWLRRRKESKAPPPFYETLPHQTRCRSCQKRPAETHYSVQLPDWPICHICFAKRETGGIWFSRFEGHLRRQPSLYQDYFHNAPHTNMPDMPHTVDEIGQACRARPGYMAVLYLDGDRVGQLLEKIQDKADYRQLSRDIDEATWQSVFTALAKHLRPAVVRGSDLRQEASRVSGAGEDVLIYPFEIITIGGDDLLLIVPADKAIPIALEIGQGFQSEMGKRGAAANKVEWGELTMSAGVILADDHTPVQMLVKLAKELLQEAKRSDHKEGSLDFHILKSADMLDDRVEKVREQYPYTLKYKIRGGWDLSLLSRPYSYPDMDRLWRGLHQIRGGGVATGQMQMLAESLLLGRAEATLFYHYQLKRHGGFSGSSLGYQALDQLLKTITGLDDRHPYPWQEWREGNVRYRTPLWDMAELYEFVDTY